MIMICLLRVRSWRDSLSNPCHGTMPAGPGPRPMTRDLGHHDVSSPRPATLKHSDAAPSPAPGPCSAAAVRVTGARAGQGHGIVGSHLALVRDGQADH
jgi:hypothetical protein